MENSADNPHDSRNGPHESETALIAIQEDQINIIMQSSRIVLAGITQEQSALLMRIAAMTTRSCCIIFAVTAFTFGNPMRGMASGSVTVEAESGTLGSDVTIVNGDPTYITVPTGTLVSGNPGTASRVASYSVTFPSAGTYNLFARVRTGPASFDDDSCFYANGFGSKSPAVDDDWILCNNTVDGGFATPTDVVTGAGAAGGQVWKWMNLSDFTGDTGETPITFTVTDGDLDQTFQLGGRENGFDIDKFVFGKTGIAFTVGDLDAGTTPQPPPEVGKILVPEILGNGDLRISYYGLAGGQYAQEWTESLVPPTTWTPLATNTADSEGLVVFTKTLLGSNEFCRVHDVSQPEPVDDLTATAGPGQVSLSWGDAAFATSYNVRRSTVDGGPYATITNITTTGFLNTGLVNETPYYFVIAAVNANGVSADSSQASAIPSTNITELPLVYSVENTGAAYRTPPLPAMNNLPIILPLPDPFMWSASDPNNWTDPTGRSTNFNDWSQRRAEIKAELEYYEIGYRPPVDPSMVFASVSGSGTSRTLTVRTTNIVNGVVRTLTQTAAIGLPGSSGTFPVMIGMNSPSGSLPLGGRPIATITYSHNQVTTYNSPANSDPYYALYAPPFAAPAPFQANINIDTTGQYSAWSWGVSRLIDGLYKLNGDLGGGVQLNLERIAVTGCSYAGKMALFSGAFDERIALTIPQESGGGGVPNWRYSYQEEPTGSVEGLAQTSSQWFKNDMFAFGGASTARLPHDHHELMAMVAPRALFATANPQGAAWLSNPSAYVSFKAVERIYEGWGIGDRFGYNGLTGAGHCGVTTLLPEDSGAFLDKFLLGMTDVNTITNRHVPANYSTIDYARWTAWWGTTNPTFTGTAAVYTFTNTYEPECVPPGSAWQIVSDATASNGKYVTVTPGIQSLGAAPTGATNLIVIPFNVPTNGNATVFARVNCASADDDSFWVSLDGGNFSNLNGLPTGGWIWTTFATGNMTAGAHTLTIGYREDGARLDKILVSDYPFSPSPGSIGPDAAVLCP